MGYKPVPRLTHELLGDDFDRRKEFCEEILQLTADDPNFLSRILWTDEAKFHVNGVVNRHNSVYWSRTNDHVTISKPVNSPGVVVWGGIYSGGVIGPFFFDDTVTGETYLSMLKDWFQPQFQQMNGHEEMFFMQDGAPPHFALSVRAWLDGNFAGRWIGRRGAIDWAPRSPDLTPMDFFFWGYVKDLVYSQPTVRSLGELTERIEHVFHTIPTEMCASACSSVGDRCNQSLSRC